MDPQTFDRVFKTAILSLDLGTKMGFAVTSVTDRKTLGITSGGVELPSKNPGKRLSIFGSVLDGIEKCAGSGVPQVVVYERVVRHLSGASSQLYGAFKGITQMWAYNRGVEVVEVSVSEIRKFSTGKGNSSKDVSTATMKREHPHVLFESDDECDALWLMYFLLDRDYEIDRPWDLPWRSLRLQSVNFSQNRAAKGGDN